MDIIGQRLKIYPAANGLLTAAFCLDDGRTVCLHSQVDPMEEVRFLLGATPIRENMLYVVFGFGLGYHVRELLRRIPRSSRILVVEPQSLPLASWVMSHLRSKGQTWFQDPRLFLGTYHDVNKVAFDMAGLCVRHALHQVRVFTHIPSTQACPEFYQEAAGSVRATFQTNLNYELSTTLLKLDNNLNNYWANLPVSWQCPSVRGLAGMWAGRPAVVVSAGPSLSDRLEELAGVQGKALIICVGTAAKVLATHGIRPDFIITIDPFEANMKHFLGWDTGQVPLVYYHQVWRGIPATYRGPKFWFIMKNDAPLPLTAGLPENPFETSGTVAMAALQLAHLVKAGTVALVGQDFAFPDGHTHAEGVSGNKKIDENNLPGGYFWVPGVSGKPVLTEYTYNAYRLFMQEYIRNHPQVRFVNTSQTGARIEGTIAGSLGEFVRQTAGNHGVSVNDVVAKTMRAYCPPRDKDLQAWAAKAESDLSGFLRRTGDADFRKMTADFRRTSVYKSNGALYNQVFYALAVRHRQGSPEEESCGRLLEHSRFVLNELTKIRTTKG